MTLLHLVALLYVILAAIYIGRFLKPDRFTRPLPDLKPARCGSGAARNPTEGLPSEVSVSLRTDIPRAGTDTNGPTEGVECTVSKTTSETAPAHTEQREVAIPPLDPDLSPTATIRDIDAEDYRLPFRFTTSKNLSAADPHTLSPRIMLDFDRESDQWARSVYQLLPPGVTDKMILLDEGLAAESAMMDCGRLCAAAGTRTRNCSLHLAVEDNDRTVVAEPEPGSGPEDKDKDATGQPVLHASDGFSVALEECLARLEKLSVSADDSDPAVPVSVVASHDSPLAPSPVVVDVRGQEEVLQQELEQEKEGKVVVDQDVSQACPPPSEPTATLPTAKEQTESSVAQQQQQEQQQTAEDSNPVSTTNSETAPPSTDPNNRPVIVKRFLRNLIANNKSHNDRRPPSGLPSRLNPATHAGKSDSSRPGPAAPTTSTKRRGGRQGRGARSASTPAAGGANPSPSVAAPQKTAVADPSSTRPCLPPRVTRKQRIQAVHSGAAKENTLASPPPPPTTPSAQLPGAPVSTTTT